MAGDGEAGVSVAQLHPRMTCKTCGQAIAAHSPYVVYPPPFHGREHFDCAYTRVGVLLADSEAARALLDALGVTHVDVEPR